MPPASDPSAARPCAANYAPLTPQSFLARSVRVYPGKPAVLYGERSLTTREFHEGACRFANALLGAGLRRGESVAILAPNTPAHLIAAFGTLLSGVAARRVSYTEFKQLVRANEVSQVVVSPTRIRGSLPQPCQGVRRG